MRYNCTHTRYASSRRYDVYHKIPALYVTSLIILTALVITISALKIAE